MKSKIILTCKTSESHVATFNTYVEACECAALLQAKTDNPDFIYYVEYKKRRVIPDPLTRILPYLNKGTIHNLKNYFIAY